MSHPSQPGNRPPNARVFRPFTGGGTAGQGVPTSPTPPASPQRRAGQPFRPFVGAQGATIAPTEQPPPPIPTIVATAVEPIVESIPAPAPTYHAPEPAPIAHEAWERYHAPEPGPYVAPEPHTYIAPKTEAFNAPEPNRSVLEGPIAEPAQTVRNSEITVEVPQIDDAQFELEPEPIVSAEPAKARPPITVEVPAIPSEEAMAAIRDVAHEGDLWETAYSSAPIEQPSSEIVIDEVEAAFSESAPSSNDRTRLDDALVAAITLEAIARRLRNGEVDIRPTPGASMSAEESALATVLAALLATR